VAKLSVKELLEAGVHFGHRSSRWNPKMKQYIHGKRNLIHIIDLKETVRGLVKARTLLRNLGRRGGEALMVGTKKQAVPIIRAEAQRGGIHFAAERWLGGTLTNYATIRQRLTHFEELEGIIESGDVEGRNKKESSKIRREYNKINRNLEGLREMERLPDVMIVLDPKKEANAVREARKLHIPIIGLVDTDSDPETVDIVVPCNDDAIRSIQVLVSKLVDAYLEGTSELDTKDREGAPKVVVAAVVDKDAAAKDEAAKN